MDSEKNWGFQNLRYQRQVKHELKSKLGKIFANEKVLEEYSAKIYETDLYFYEYYKKIEVDKNRRKYILFRIDVYFFEHELAVEADEKSHSDRDLIFQETRQEALEKKLNCEFIRINTSNKGYDPDYEMGRVQKYNNESAKKLTLDEISKMMLGMKFKQNHEIKSKTLDTLSIKTCLCIKMSDKKYVKKKIIYNFFF